MKPWRYVVIEGCWFHHLGMNEGSHADALQLSGGTAYVIRG